MSRDTDLTIKLIETFGSGVVVSVLLVSGVVFTGQIVAEVRHCDDALAVDIQPEFLLLKLTVAIGPYVVGQTIAINVLLIETIG